MLEPIDTPREITSVFEGIENQLDRSLNVQKDAIEKSLLEKVQREKEEAQKKIDAAEREFTEDKRALDSYKSTLAELKATRDQLQGRIKGHLDRAVSCQQMMEKMSNQALEEYEKVDHLTLELDGIRQRAEKETVLLKKFLEEKYGIRSEFAAVFEPAESLTRLKLEMAKMKKVRELLAAGLEAEAVEAAVEPAVERVAERPVERHVLQGRPVDRFIDLPEPEEAPTADEAAVPEVEPAVSFDAGDDFEVEDLRMLTDRLAQFRRTEPVLNGTEFSYYQKGKRMVLDGEAFVRNVVRISEVAKGLHVNLGQKEMSKDLFLIKQEILNQQEILRKTFLRAVRFCEKEDGALPQSVADVLNVRVMKDILERLTFGNWSNPADFNSFMENVAFLKVAFKEKIQASREYSQSVLEQLENSPVVHN